MPALNGQFALSPSGGYVNPYVTSALRSNDASWIGWPCGQADIGTFDAVAVALGSPAQPRKAIPGMLAASYMDDYYNRVHLLPSSIALGNLATAQTRSIEVWNAYIDQSLTLDAVQASNDGGIAVTAPGALPLTFAPLQHLIWSISVTPQGPAVIDAQLQWQFASSADDVTLSITGNRIVAWCVPPDWSQPINETLAWLTDVQQAVDGSQVRQQIREAPRRQWEWRIVADGQGRRIIEQMLYDWSAQTWLVPVWPDITLLGAALAAGSDTVPVSTANLDFAVGSLVMLWASPTAFEIAEVSAVGANALGLARPTAGDWPAGTRLYPCRQGVLTDYPQLPRTSSDLATAQVRFQAAEPCDWTPSPPSASYLGYPVLEQRPDQPSSTKPSFTRITITVDNDIGLPVIDDPSGQPWTSQSHGWLLVGQSDRGAFRSLLYWLAGRANALWLPSWSDDVVLADAVPGNTASLTVEWVGITRYGKLQPGRRHLRIELYDGSIFYRKVTAAVESGTASEQLAIDSSLGVDIQPGDVRQISWMMLASLAADSVQIAHVNDSMGVATSTATFMGVPREEP